ncbi:unnamed protein product [Lymnaea stagnalis]|uniref:Glycosyltransferase family 92 protein n=1 Tax=Lymnaea stagnalis TaxID=6523 RepID=A0AAV2IRK7_LYMST
MYNRVLGAQHFYVYNHSVSNTTDAVLRHYQRLGLLTVMPWPLPTLEVWYYGQILAINDCVYRNTFVSRFVVIQDTDEYIVPNRHGSWLELINAVDAGRAKGKVPPLGSYIFESSLHCNNPRPWEWEKVKKDFSISPEDEKFIRRHSLLPFIQLHRMDYIYKYKSRTKAIVRPELILYAGIHYTRKHRERAQLTVVSNDLAIVHHFSKKRRTQVVDTTTLKFKDQVFPMVKRSIESFEFLAGTVT